MTDRIEASMVHASMNALMHLMEGASPTNTAPPAVVYTAFVGGDERMVRIVCQATADNGRDGILAFFEPTNLDAGPTRIGVTLVEGAMIKLQLGRLWLAPRAERAVLVPRNIGKAHGHYVIEDGRIVQRAGWPAETLERGTRRAEARLAELTADYARGALSAF